MRRHDFWIDVHGLAESCREERQKTQAKSQDILSSLSEVFRPALKGSRPPGYVNYWRALALQLVEFVHIHQTTNLI